MCNALLVQIISRTLNTSVRLFNALSMPDERCSVENSEILQHFAKFMTVDVSNYITSFHGLSKISVNSWLSLWLIAMVFRYISPDVKQAAIRIYENDLMDLVDILAYLDISESTFFHALWLQRETGNVEHPKSTICGRPWKLHFDDLTYMTALIKPSWLVSRWIAWAPQHKQIHFCPLHNYLPRARVVWGFPQKAVPDC